VTEQELQALADEIADRIRAGGGQAFRAGGRRQAAAGGRRQAAGGSAAALPPVRGALALTPDPVTAAEIAWRGPVQTAAWSPAQGARRVADFVDHTLLKPEATREEIVKLCAEARQHRFAAVCVNGTWVELCVKELRGVEVAVASVVGFPLGAMTRRAKAFEAREAAGLGAREVDMVAAIGRIKGGQWACVEDDIRAVVEAAHPAIVKVIIESALLTPEEIIKVSALAKEAGAHFVKTSTGFHAAGGASVEAVRLMRLVVGDDLGVKASGGVRDCQTALAMIAAGANRIGTSSGVAFVTCLGPGPLPLAELLKQPHAHGATCTSGTCQSAGGQY
jgi:deoxyribose-phosphate aldolase